MSGRMEHRAGAAGGIERTTDQAELEARGVHRKVRGVCQFFRQFFGGANVDARGFVLELAEIQASRFQAASSDGSGARQPKLGCRTGGASGARVVARTARRLMGASGTSGAPSKQ